MESIDHLFIHCKFSHSLRCSLLRRCGVLSGRPGSLAGTIQAWRYSSFSRSGLILCRPTPFAILWLTWKERNDRVFNGSSSSMEDIYELVVVRISKWASFKSEFDRLRVEGVLHNWEASLLCGLWWKNWYFGLLGK